ncbi:MAG: tetratricopeptide repeat protein [Phycisphaerales bacterium]
MPVAVAAAVSRYWEERRQGRAASIDQCMATLPNEPDYVHNRATAIKVIASQASQLSSVTDETDPGRAAWETLATQIGPTTAQAMSAKGPIPQIDGYDLVACLGQGGMGAVYEGYQRSTGRRVAIKFLLDRLGSSDAARQRFEREVEVVARLQHPGIVSVLDSGVKRGKYFYVMEFVEGRPLDETTRPGTWAVREALELMVKVCDAVDYAHQRGVLHRDLKPSNVVIDAAGAPHLLDFGLAKVFDPNEAPSGPHGAMGLTISGPGQLMGTLAYMASEQAKGKNDEASVRTDEYALAAMTYELLTGRLPCLMGASVAETLNGIIAIPPPAPTSLRKGLSRDLDAVLLKGLEKAPEKRYATVGEFAADLRRHLSGEPVQARRVGQIGRARRWVARNRAISTVIGAAVVTIVTVSVVLMSRVVRERDMARDNFVILRSILEAADPERTTGVTVLQLLDGAANRLDDSPPERDTTEAEIREIIGGVYRKFMEYEKARVNQAKALAIRERHARGDDPAVAEAIHNLAASYWWDGKYTEAEALYLRALAMRERLHPDGDPTVAMSMSHLAACRLRMGKKAEARDLYQKALDLRRRLYGAEHEEVAQSINNLARCFLEAEQYDLAERQFGQALGMIRKLKGDSDKGTAAASQNLAECLVRRGEVAAFAGEVDAARQAAEAAREPFERALRIRTKTYPQGHHLVAASLTGMARAELLLGEPNALARAADLARRGLDMVRKFRRADTPQVGEALETLGLVQLRTGDPEAVTNLRLAVEIAEKARPPAELLVARLRRELAVALAKSGVHPEAIATINLSLAALKRLRGEEDAETRRTGDMLKEISAAAGQAPESAGAAKVLVRPNP